MEQEAEIIERLKEIERKLEWIAVKLIAAEDWNAKHYEKDYLLSREGWNG